MTIITTSTDYAPAHYDAFFVVSDAKASNPVTYPNYKYIADIYVNGVFVARLKKFPEPDYNYGVFNIGVVVRDYIKAVFSPSTALLSMDLGQGLFNADIQMKFGEEYGFTATYNIISDISRKLFNYYLRFPDGDNAPLNNFINKIVTNGFKTSAEQSTLKAMLTTNYLFVNYFTTTTTPITISVAGKTTYSTTVTPANAFDMIVLNISPTVLNALQAGIIDSTIDYYLVTIGSETIRINLFCEAIYKVYPVHFLTQYGGFETVFFNKLSRKNVKIDKKSFGVLNYKVNSDGSVRYKDNSSSYYEADYNYSTTFSSTLTLNSELLTDVDYVWLEDLIESPLVYVQMNGYFYPVKVTNTDYEIRKTINDNDLSNLSITVDFGRTFNTQFR